MSQPTSASSPSATGARRVPWRSPSGDPPWARPALLVLLAATTALYAWGLGASDWANAFYSAAVQAGAHSWEAFFFGSSDAANFITVDKTPLALWPMDLAARIFGVNSWSILVPQALMGVATVGVLHATVRRSLLPLGPRAAAGGALLAGAVLATTPVAALMFRYNNPDALLVLLLTLGAYALLRAREEAGTRWLILAATCVGLGFLAKMLQAFLVVPAFGLVYLVLAPAGMRRKLWQLTLATAAMVVSAGWWVGIVAVVPASSRPYIGGSQHNSVLELALGYNGLGRLNGNETGGLGNTNQDAGWLRMFGPELGGQIGWLLPAALILLIAGLWATTRGAVRREASTRPSSPEPTRQSRPKLTALGRFRPALEHRAPLRPATAGPAEGAGQAAPNHFKASALGRAAADGPAPSWAGPLSDSEQVAESGAAPGPDTPPHEAAPARPRPADTGGLPAAFALWGGWLLVTDVVFSLMRGIFHGYYTVALAPPVAALIGMGAAVLWSRRRSAVFAVTLAGATALTGWWSFQLLGRTPSFEPWLRVPVLVAGLVAAAAVLAGRWLPGRVVLTGAAVAVAVALAGPTAYAVDTATTPHRGAIPAAGPAAMGGPGGFPGGGRGGFRGGTGGRGGSATSRRGGGFPPGAGGLPQPPNGGMGGPGAPGQNPGTGGGPTGGGPTGGGAMGGRPMGGGMGGPTALLDATTPSTAVTALLKQNAGSYTWAAATVGSNSAAGYQLASGKPVMAIGGFNGTDPAPSLARFQQYVRDGRLHYFLPGRTMPSRGGTSGSDNGQQITSWVTQTFTAKTVDGITVYDLS